MSKLVNSLVPEETYTITETVSTGKFYVTRVGSITKQPTPVFIAENITEISSWLRTHPEITEATVVSIWSKDLLEKQSTYTVGPNDSVVFSPDVNRPQYGGKVKNFLNTVLNRVFDARKFRTAVNTAYADVPEEDRPGFAITKNKSNTGKFGNEQGRVAELFAGTLDDARKAAIRNAVRDVFKQEEVGIKDAKTGQITFNTEVPDDAQEESTMENDDKITESMFLTGADNTLNGNAQLDYRNMLAGEIFGAAAFSTQRPSADTHESVNTVMDTQAVEGMGVLRPVGAPAANMNEDTSFNKHMLNMAKSLFRANRMDEAAKVVDAIDSPSTAAAKVLEAAIATDGVVDEKLTEDLYNAAAYFSARNLGEDFNSAKVDSMSIDALEKAAQRVTSTVHPDYEEWDGAEKDHVKNEVARQLSTVAFDKGSRSLAVTPFEKKLYADSYYRDLARFNREKGE